MAVLVLQELPYRRDSAERNVTAGLLVQEFPQRIDEAVMSTSICGSQREMQVVDDDLKTPTTLVPERYATRMVTLRNAVRYQKDVRLGHVARSIPHESIAVVLAASVAMKPTYRNTAVLVSVVVPAGVAAEAPFAAAVYEGKVPDRTFVARWRRGSRCSRGLSGISRLSRSRRLPWNDCAGRASLVALPPPFLKVPAKPVTSIVSEMFGYSALA